MAAEDGPHVAVVIFLSMAAVGAVVGALWACALRCSSKRGVGARETYGPDRPLAIGGGGLSRVHPRPGRNDIGDSVGANVGLAFPQPGRSQEEALRLLALERKKTHCLSMALNLQNEFSQQLETVAACLEMALKPRGEAAQRAATHMEKERERLRVVFERQFRAVFAAPSVFSPQLVEHFLGYDGEGNECCVGSAWTDAPGAIMLAAKAADAMANKNQMTVVTESAAQFKQKAYQARIRKRASTMYNLEMIERQRAQEQIKQDQLQAQLKLQKRLQLRSASVEGSTINKDNS